MDTPFSAIPELAFSVMLPVLAVARLLSKVSAPPASTCMEPVPLAVIGDPVPMTMSPFTPSSARLALGNSVIGVLLSIEPLA